MPRIVQLVSFAGELDPIWARMLSVTSSNRYMMELTIRTQWTSCGMIEDSVEEEEDDDE